MLPRMSSRLVACAMRMTAESAVRFAWSGCGAASTVVMGSTRGFRHREVVRVAHATVRRALVVGFMSTRVRNVACAARTTTEPFMRHMGLGRDAASDVMGLSSRGFRHREVVRVAHATMGRALVVGFMSTGRVPNVACAARTTTELFMPHMGLGRDAASDVMGLSSRGFRHREVVRVAHATMGRAFAAGFMSTRVRNVAHATWGVAC